VKIKKVIVQKNAVTKIEDPLPEFVKNNLYIDLKSKDLFRFTGFSNDKYHFDEIDIDLKTVLFDDYSYSMTELQKDMKLIALTDDIIRKVLNPTDLYSEIEKIINQNEEQIDVETKCEALIGRNHSNLVQVLKFEIETKKREIEIYKILLEHKVNALDQIAHEFEKKLKKIRKVIGIFEVFLGVNEEIIQIQEGANTSKDEKLYIHQMVYFMDEEIGDPTDGGLDHSRLKEFDDWLVENENYKKLCPHEKSIIAIQPRRYKKDYDDVDYLAKSFFDQYDKKTYWLIRNGENLYRIVSDMEVGNTRVFPQRDYKISSRKHSFDWEKQNPNAISEDDVFVYKKIAVFLQGVIQRTPIFEFDTRINPIENTGIVFVYDVDDYKLPNGRLPWIDWKKQINSKIKLGSRIIFTNCNLRFDFLKHRGWKIYENPASGIYNINRLRYREQYKIFDVCTRKDELNIVTKDLNFEWLYIAINPGDLRWKYNRRENDVVEYKRKRAITLEIRRDDDFILNYDDISVDDIDYYLNNRIDRANYLRMIPSLIEVKKQKIEEMKLEHDFAQLVKNRNPDIDDKLIQKAIEWWKKKVVFKRPITSDDAKALRMIESKIKKVEFEEEDEQY